MSDSLQYTVAHGEMSVWVMLPTARSQCVLRFDGSPLSLGADVTRRTRSIARAMLTDAIEQLDELESARD